MELNLLLISSIAKIVILLRVVSYVIVWVWYMLNQIPGVPVSQKSFPVCFLIDAIIKITDMTPQVNGNLSPARAHGWGRGG